MADRSLPPRCVRSPPVGSIGLDQPRRRRPRERAERDLEPAGLLLLEHTRLRSGERRTGRFDGRASTGGATLAGAGLARDPRAPEDEEAAIP